jgi:hypothetical protein
MNDYPNSVKETLTSLINDMSASPALFVKNPGIDFTRKRKLPFETVMQLLLSMGGNSIYRSLATIKSSHRAINLSTLATMRCCSAMEGSGKRAFLPSSVPNLGILTPYEHFA